MVMSLCIFFTTLQDALHVERNSKPVVAQVACTVLLLPSNGVCSLVANYADTFKPAFHSCTSNMLYNSGAPFHSYAAN